MDHGFIQVEGSWRVLQGPLKGPKWPKWQNMTKIMSPFCFFFFSKSGRIHGYPNCVLVGRGSNKWPLYKYKWIVSVWAGFVSHHLSFTFWISTKILRNQKFCKKRVNYLPIMNNLRVSSQSMWKFKGYIDV